MMILWNLLNADVQKSEDIEKLLFSPIKEASVFTVKQDKLAVKL